MNPFLSRLYKNTEKALAPFNLKKEGVIRGGELRNESDEEQNKRLSQLYMNQFGGAGPVKNVYHGYTGPMFDKFKYYDLGPHFGNQFQAKAFLKNWAPSEFKRLKHADLDITNPVDLIDVGNWHNPNDVAKMMQRYKPNILSKETLKYIEENARKLGGKTYRGKELETSPLQRSMLERIVNDIKNKGYDSVRYENASEGISDILKFSPNKPNLGYILFDQGRIKNLTDSQVTSPGLDSDLYKLFAQMPSPEEVSLPPYMY
jgi:hypothetical protein